MKTVSERTLVPTHATASPQTSDIFPIRNLPPELVYHIISFAIQSDHTAFLRLSRVCRLFRDYFSPNIMQNCRINLFDISARELAGHTDVVSGPGQNAYRARLLYWGARLYTKSPELWSSSEVQTIINPNGATEEPRNAIEGTTSPEQATDLQEAQKKLTELTKMQGIYNPEAPEEYLELLAKFEYLIQEKSVLESLYATLAPEKKSPACTLKNAINYLSSLSRGAPCDLRLQAHNISLTLWQLNQKNHIRCEIIESAMKSLAIILPNPHFVVAEFMGQPVLSPTSGCPLFQAHINIYLADPKLFDEIIDAKFLGCPWFQNRLIVEMGRTLYRSSKNLQELRGFAGRIKAANNNSKEDGLSRYHTFTLFNLLYADLKTGIELNEEQLRQLGQIYQENHRPICLI